MVDNKEIYKFDARVEGFTLKSLRVTGIVFLLTSSPLNHTVGS